MLYDLLIVGGGCAGLGASIYARRFNMNVLVLTEGLGGTITTTHLVENYPGFIALSGQELADHLIAHAKANDVPFKLGSRVNRITKEGDVFKVEFGKEVFEARTALVATGTTYRQLGVTGEKEFASKGVSYCATCDAPFYKKKRVIIVGGGDSAVKESLILAEHAEHVTIVYRGEAFTKAEYINLKRMEATPNITAKFKTNIVEIMGDKVVNAVRFDSGEIMETQGVFIEIGRIPLTSMVDELGVAKNEKGEIIIGHMSETNIPGFYSAGDVTDTEWKQAIVGIAEGTKAAYSAYEYVSNRKSTPKTNRAFYLLGVTSFVMPLIAGFILITGFPNIYKILAEFSLVLIYGLYLLGVTKGSLTLKNWLCMDDEAVKSNQMMSFFDGIGLAFLSFVIIFFGFITVASFF